MHVRGFTADPASGVSAPGAPCPAGAAALPCRRCCRCCLPACLLLLLQSPAARRASSHRACTAHRRCRPLPPSRAGTYRGLVERLDYLQRLGINAIELMPVHEFNELEYYQARRGRARGMRC